MERNRFNVEQEQTLDIVRSNVARLEYTIHRYISIHNITVHSVSEDRRSDLKAALVFEKPNLDIVHRGLSVVASS